MECLFAVLLIAFSVERGEALISCRASTTCVGGPGDDVGMAVDGRGCCLDNPEALTYVSSEGNCVACVVVGFFNTTFSGVEQGPGHSVPVGYQKGAQIARQNLVFSVQNTPGTARLDSQFDYTINSVRVRALVSATQPDNVVVTFRVDAIAQEPNETFTLTLNPLVQPTPREGLFFLDTIQVIIVDKDNVQFSFTEDCYRANEPSPGGPATTLPVIVTKSTRIATRVELVVVPLTVQEARATSLPLPSNIPVNNPHSPSYANLNDFDNTNITLIFDPDEDAQVYEVRVPILITDDAINEVTEQVFVVELILVDSLDSATVDLTTRPSSLCRIIDYHDVIRIGFELPGYTYEEAQFDELIDEFYLSPIGRPELSGPIYLVKENNVITEQTFLVSIQITDSAPYDSSIQSATIGQDYHFGQPGQRNITKTFPAFRQRIPVLFELIADTLPEGTEAFHVSVSPENTRNLDSGIVERFPISLHPLIVASEIHITILDDDPIIIGFTNTSYNVNETIGTLQVDVQVFNPSYVNQPLPAAVNLVIQTVSGSATGGSDYQEINAAKFDVFLFFDNVNRQQSFRVQWRIQGNPGSAPGVTIINDSVFELDTEEFTLELRLDPFATSLSSLILRPNVSVVYISDIVVVIGFLNTSYAVGENDGQVNIQIEVIQGSLQRPVVVQFSTGAISAAAASDYISISQAMTFSNSSTIHTVQVPVVNNSVLELSEVFTASLLLENSSDPVKLMPNSVSVMIIDDDELVFGFRPTEYEVHESDRSITVEIFFIHGIPGDYQPLVLISTHSGTAIEGADFAVIASSQITFTVGNRVRSLVIPIIYSNSTEGREEFSVTLDEVILIHTNTVNRTTLNLSDQERARLILNPRRANITILDDNVAVIGFLKYNLSVFEGKGTLNFAIGVLQGYLDTFVTILFTVEASSAKAGLDYIKASKYLTFTGDSIQTVSILIIDDGISEPPETFFGLLSSADGTVILPNIRLVPNRATATIIDNDENNSPVIVLAVVLICILVFLTLITVTVIVICLVFKKSNRKKKLPEHVYDSVSSPPSSHSEPTSLNYDEVKTINADSSASSAKFELTENVAYSSRKPSAAAAAETTSNTESTAADL